MPSTREMLATSRGRGCLALICPFILLFDHGQIMAERVPCYDGHPKYRRVHGKEGGAVGVDGRAGESLSVPAPGEITQVGYH